MSNRCGPRVRVDTRVLGWKVREPHTLGASLARTYFRMMESGRASLYSLDEIAGVLGVHVSELMDPRDLLVEPKSTAPLKLRTCPKCGDTGERRRNKCPKCFYAYQQERAKRAAR